MKRWLRRVVVAVVLTLVVRTVWLVGEREWVRAEGEGEYAAAAATTDIADPGWRWDELTAKRPRPPEGRNGMDVVLRARDALPAAAGPAHVPGPFDPAEPPEPSSARLPAAVVAAARERVTAAREAVALARTLKDYTQGYYPLVLDPNPWETKLPHIDAVRRVAVFLRWDGILAADAGDAGIALDAADALLNPFLISQLVRISIRVNAWRNLERVLAQTEPDPARLARVQAAWAAEADEPLLLYGLRGERAINDVTFQNLLDGTRLWRDRTALHTYLTAAVAAARRPVHEQRAAIAALMPPRPEEFKLAALFCPAVEKCTVACWRSTAQARCVAVALACERYRRAHGRWPDALADLAPVFLPAVPFDPFDNQPLRYRRLPDGAVVYSIGPNRLDDDGDTARPADGTPAPDDGFRLWNPDAGGRPAPDDEP
ncbi:MAG TPA: hypothetical protein VH092_28855 [Urbifossiella sp.]|jgi:hypothetical protein|nr:hypothetical protein [Urbifossiella sp.]